MTKVAMVEELKAAGIILKNVKKMTRTEVEEKYNEYKNNTQKEEETMTKEEAKVQEQNTQDVNKREAQAAERDTHIDLVVDTIDKALNGNAEADVYPNLGDWIKIKLGGKTVLEARFGKKDLRVQAAEDVAKEAGVTYKLVMSFSKPATIFLQYNADGMSQLEALIGAADTVAAEKLVEKEAKEAAKKAEAEAKAAAKAEEKAKKEAARKAAREAKAQAKAEEKARKKAEKEAAKAAAEAAKATAPEAKAE